MKSPGFESAQSMEEKMTAFKSDPLLMDATTRFVNEVLERAKEEAIKRMKERAAAVECQDTDNGLRKRGRWSSRARGFLMRMFASVCLCNNSGGKGS